MLKGVNPDKPDTAASPLPESLQNRQIEHYDGLLTDFLGELPYPVTVIRGLRNATDLQQELIQYRFLQDLSPSIKIVSIFCDREFEHISSSAIRMLQKYGSHYKYLVK